MCVDSSTLVWFHISRVTRDFCSALPHQVAVQWFGLEFCSSLKPSFLHHLPKTQTYLVLPYQKVSDSFSNCGGLLIPLSELLKGRKRGRQVKVISLISSPLNCCNHCRSYNTHLKGTSALQSSDKASLKQTGVCTTNTTLGAAWSVSTCSSRMASARVCLTRFHF